ncbi:hypothetical protein Shyhy01_23530 [Streptomyces hygroscopicus subsp. hygroscopicus]|nr:hypothetical protein Shyhy01_23530 [Streptomyces hygroscopicus subsp. hygroscopicus]
MSVICRRYVGGGCDLERVGAPQERAAPERKEPVIVSSASQSRPWDVHRPRSAEGRIFLVTGGNAGIGWFAAEQLAATGAVAVLGSRKRAGADAAMASIRSRVPARVRHLRLDLADLSSLKTTVDTLDLERLDAVVHDAGVVLDEPPRRETEDGHELMFATNHLGHFALTQWPSPLLSAAPAARRARTPEHGPSSVPSLTRRRGEGSCGGRGSSACVAFRGVSPSPLI